MYEDVKSSALSTVRKPEIRTEVDTQEYKTERTVKLSGKGDPGKSDTIEIAPGDKVLVPRPFQPGRAAPPPQETMPQIQKPVHQKPQKPVHQKPVQKPSLQKPPQKGRPVAEDTIQP